MPCQNTHCPVSVPILTQKSATYFRKLLILIGLNRFAERARFELAVISPPPYCQDYFCKYLNVNYLQFYLLVKFALLCLISVSVQSNKNN